MDFVQFLIHDNLWSFIYIISYNICSAWFLDIRISTCLLLLFDFGFSLVSQAIFLLLLLDFWVIGFEALFEVLPETVSHTSAIFGCT